MQPTLVRHRHDGDGALTNARPRYAYVDLARGFAIGLALFSHVMLGVGGWSALDEGPTWMYGFRILTRTATPTFIFLFGVSSEFAYVRRWGSDRAGTVRRLLKRALQCYAALIAVALAGAVGAIMTWPEAILGLAFLFPVVNGSIFAFYVFALLLSLALIPLRRKIGLLPTLAVTLAWWPIAAMIRPAITLSPELDALFSRLLGVGSQFGPSVFHSMALVVAGMIAGDFIRNFEDRKARWRALMVIMIGLIGVAGAIATHGWVGAVSGFTAEFRAANHYGYYSIGLFLAVGVLSTCWLVTRCFTRMGTRGPGFFGGNSLQAFAIGNVVINLFIGHVDIDAFIPAAILSLTFVVSFWLAFGVWIKLYKSPGLSRLRKYAGA